MKPTVTLTERRSRELRLPRSEVDFLLANARHVIDLAPTHERGRYRLTPRGYVGLLISPKARYAIRAKIPWPNLRLLLGLSPDPAGPPSIPGAELLAVLATEFADRLEIVTGAGLVAGYSDTDAVSQFLRGKLRTADQMRDSATRGITDRFHIDEPVFDLNTPWNQIPKAAATALLRYTPVPLALRKRLESVALPLAAVADTPPTDVAFTAAYAEPRAAGYRTLLDVCRLVLNGLAGADPLAREHGAFLIDLGSAFERYVATALARELTARPRWRVEAQPSYALGPTMLTPDILMRKDGSPRLVLDTKWKTSAPDATDLHQVLAYATLTGAPRVGLVYPGRTDARAHFTTPDGKICVSRYCLRVIGSAADLARSVAALARDARRK